jgi:hypothetical protein
LPANPDYPINPVAPPSRKASGETRIQHTFSASPAPPVLRGAPALRKIEGNRHGTDPSDVQDVR